MDLKITIKSKEQQLVYLLKNLKKILLQLLWMVMEKINLKKHKNGFIIKQIQKFCDYIKQKKRKEFIFIRLFYHIHLILTFLFTFKWISFGNFTSFHSKNIKNILFKNQSCLAHSASIIRNCKIKRLYAKRGKRYFDNSNLNFIDLIEHSLRINAVFLKRIFFISSVYSFTIFFLIDIFFIKFLVLLSLFIFNFLIIFMSKNIIKYFKLDKKKNIKLF